MLQKLQIWLNYVTKILLCLGLILGSFFAGVFFPVVAQEEDLSYLLAKVLKISQMVKTQMLKADITEEQLFEGAIKGLIAQLSEPYTRYLKAESFQEFSEQQQGEFNGIGIQITMSQQYLIINRVVENSPAEKQGLKVLDEIIEINDQPTINLSFEEAQEKLAGDGKAGSTVKLTINRPSTQEKLEISVQREPLKNQVVTSEILENDIAYLHLSSFVPAQSDLEVKAALEDLQQKNIKGLIFDVRNNPGGALSNVVSIANFFLKAVPIVRVIDRNQHPELFEASNNPLLPETLPVVILINGGSASASETLAAALKDNNRATLIGTRTFGKGLVQSVFPLRNGGGLIMTTSKYLTASGQDIDQKGIEPHIAIPFPDESAHAVKKEADPQIQAAIKHLNDKLLTKKE